MTRILKTWKGSPITYQPLKQMHVLEFIQVQQGNIVKRLYCIYLLHVQLQLF